MSETVFSFGLFIVVFEGDSMIPVKKVEDGHSRTARRTGDGIIAEGRKDSGPPGREGSKSLVFLPGDSPANTGVRLAMAGIEAVITDHFEVLFGDVAD